MCAMNPRLLRPRATGDLSTLPLAIRLRTKHIALGDSITVGLEATVQTVGGYAYRFASENNLTITNLAQSGQGVWQCANAIRQATIDRPNTVVTLMGGLNDTRRATNLARLRKKIEACATSVAIHAFCTTKVAANSSSVSKTGSTSAYNAQQYGGAFSDSATAGLGALSASGAATWEYSFTGENVAVQFIGGCGGIGGTETFGIVDIKIDGAVVETVNLDEWYDGASDNYDNRRGPVGRIFTGLGPGSHSITVETKNNNVVPLDFFAVLDAAGSSAALILNEIPYLSAAGYLLTPSNGSIAAANECSAVLRRIAAKLSQAGYDAGFVRHNGVFYRLATGLSNDQIHPNNQGHADIASAMQAALLQPSGLDPDALAWKAAVVAAGSTVSTPVLGAVSRFVTGCKDDGIWSAMQSVVILAGADDLTGALVPLKGTAPTPYNFLNADYNNKTGLVGDGSTKYLDTNRNTNLDGQNDCHLAVYASTANTGLRWYAGAGFVDAGSLHMLSDSAALIARCRNSSDDTQNNIAVAGLLGVSRNNSADFVMRGNGTDYTKTRASNSPFNGNYFVYLSNGSGSFYSNARIAFYSMGGGLSLAALESRVSTLYADIGAAP